MLHVKAEEICGAGSYEGANKDVSTWSTSEEEASDQKRSGKKEGVHGSAIHPARQIDPLNTP